MFRIGLHLLAAYCTKSVREAYMATNIVYLAAIRVSFGRTGLEMSSIGGMYLSQKR